jgi:hypothetical protein
VEEPDGERWLLEIDSFRGQQVSVKFAAEAQAHQLAEAWADVQRRVELVARTMERSGFEFTVR